MSRKKDLGGKIVTDAGVDFDKLNVAMSDAINREDRYWRENDAKFRAVAQKVQSYEEFEDIVKASHIKPMTEDITQLQLGRSSWSTSGRAKQRNRRKMLMANAEEGTMRVVSKDAPPKDIVDVRSFHQNWDYLKDMPEEQYKLLKELGGKRIFHLFKEELQHDLFSQFIDVIDEFKVLPEDADIGCKLLKACSRTKRFHLTQLMLTDEEKEKIKEVALAIDSNGGCNEKDREWLMKGYPFVQFNA